MRFLCLHGMGTNHQIFEAQLAQVSNQLVGQHEFVFVNGEVDCEPAPGTGPSYLEASWRKQRLPACTCSSLAAKQA